MNSAHPPVTPEIAHEAADWILRFQECELDEHERERFECWRAQSPMHEAAWARAEQLLLVLKRVPPQWGGRLHRLGRRQALRTLGALLVLAPGSWIAAQRLPVWRADLRTARGERRSLHLADGSHLVLNTASAVDVVFDAAMRRLRLRAGEILVTTAAVEEVPHRRFVVETAQGTVRALGTRFSVRSFDGSTRVAVFEHAVEIAPLAGPTTILRGGEQAGFDVRGVAAVEPVAATDCLWERGLFAAHQIRLAELIAEIGRYRSGVVRCHPAVADMRVSGTFPMGDDDAALRLIEKTLPVHISRLGRYWVVVEPLPV